MGNRTTVRPAAIVGLMNPPCAQTQFPPHAASEVIRIGNREVKLLFYVPHLGGGGAEMNTVRIANSLAKLGVDVGIAVSKPDGSYTSLLASSIKVYVLTDGKQGSSVISLVRSILPLAKLVGKVRPDVICPVMVSSGYVVGVASALFPKNTKVYLSVQNTLRPPLTSPVARIIDRCLNQVLLRRFDHFVALSQGVAQDLADLLPFTANRTTVIHNAGVEGAAARRPVQLTRRTAQPSSISTTFIACGRLTPQKGYPYLLEAFAAVRNQCEARLIILGDGPLQEQLVQLAGRLGIKNDVEFAGFVPDPLNWFAKADVFVLASLWEGFANVIVEAMSAGLPVVSTDCPHGPAEIISDGVNGLLVKPSDSESLAQAMVAMARDPALRKVLGDNGFKRSNDFTSDAIAKSWRELLGS